jgi:hypothetical protein
VTTLAWIATAVYVIGFLGTFRYAGHNEYYEPTNETGISGKRYQPYDFWHALRSGVGWGTFWPVVALIFVGMGVGEVIGWLKKKKTASRLAGATALLLYGRPPKEKKETVTQIEAASDDDDLLVSNS